MEAKNQLIPQTGTGKMDKRSYYIINGITFYRLLSAPVLVLLITSERTDIFKWMLALSFFTDAIDGFLARYFKVSSVFGAKLDSIADDLTILAAMVGMVFLKWEFLVKEKYFFLMMLALFLIQMVLALIRYGKISSFHTYFAKLAAITQGVFILLMFFLDEPLYFLFYLAVVVTTLELVEEIIIVLILPRWETNVKGLYWVLKHKQPRQTGSPLS